jgi:hypothetical protein
MGVRVGLVEVIPCAKIAPKMGMGKFSPAQTARFFVGDLVGIYAYESPESVMS